MTIKAKTGGKWKPGQTGNPKGRPPGVGEPARLRAAIAAHVPEIIDKLVEQAKAGDAQSARILLERVLAPVKAAELPVPLTLPDGSMSDQGRAVLAAVAAGDLAPAQGAALVAAIGNLAKVVEVDELAARVAALEARNAKP